jgi:hypothetical protein
LPHSKLLRFNVECRATRDEFVCNTIICNTHTTHITITIIIIIIITITIIIISVDFDGVHECEWWCEDIENNDDYYHEYAEHGHEWGAAAAVHCAAVRGASSRPFSARSQRLVKGKKKEKKKKKKKKKKEKLISVCVFQKKRSDAWKVVLGMRRICGRFKTWMLILQMV